MILKKLSGLEDHLRFIGQTVYSIDAVSFPTFREL